MTLTFYHAPMSSSSLTEHVLAVLDIPHERVILDFSKGETRTPSFLAINPNGQVPTIVHNGTPIWESVAITFYLGETFGVEKGLYPEAGPKRGEAMKWVVWANLAVMDAGRKLMVTLPKKTLKDSHMPESKFSDEKERVAAEEKARGELGKLCGILNAALEGKEYLLGNFTVVDAHVYSIMGWLAMMKFDLAPYPNMASWAKRCSERPAIAKLAPRKE